MDQAGVRNVFVVDDRSLPRAALRAMLGGIDDLVLVGEASSGRMALPMIRQLQPDVVLMDVDMDEMDGADVTRAVLQEFPNIIVLAWTVSDSSEDLLRMMRAGCAGYVLKDVGPDELTAAIRAALRNETPVPRRLVGDVLRRVSEPIARQPANLAQLSVRERQTLELLAEGHAVKQIANALGVATSSADTYVRNLYRKLGVNNRAEAITIGYRSGLLRLNDE